MLNFELGSGDLEIMNDELGSEASGENGKLKMEFRYIGRELGFGDFNEF
jgi:hypothetical protein